MTSYEEGRIAAGELEPGEITLMHLVNVAQDGRPFNLDERVGLHQIIDYVGRLTGMDDYDLMTAKVSDWESLAQASDFAGNDENGLSEPLSAADSTEHEGIDMIFADNSPPAVAESEKDVVVDSETSQLTEVFDRVLTEADRTGELEQRESDLVRNAVERARQEERDRRGWFGKLISKDESEQPGHTDASVRRVGDDI